MRLLNFLTEHVKDTENPQTYWSHGKFAFLNSAKLVGAGIIGMVHAVFPWWFKFTTSTAVITSFKKLVDSRRHILELNAIIPNGYIDKKHLR
jgi:hypothetical protein